MHSLYVKVHIRYTYISIMWYVPLCSHLLMCNNIHGYRTIKLHSSRTHPSIGCSPAIVCKGDVVGWLEGLLFKLIPFIFFLREGQHKCIVI